jgi:hypothetical protein
MNRSTLAAAIWEATPAPGWSARQPSPAERRRAFRQADAVLALPEMAARDAVVQAAIAFHQKPERAVQLHRAVEQLLALKGTPDVETD